MCSSGYADSRPGLQISTWQSLQVRDHGLNIFPFQFLLAQKLIREKKTFLEEPSNPQHVLEQSHDNPISIEIRCSLCSKSFKRCQDISGLQGSERGVRGSMGWKHGWKQAPDGKPQRVPNTSPK